MKTVYVDDTNYATIVCPGCGCTTKIDTTKYRNTQKKLKAKCKCGEVFRFTIEFRKHYRKKVKLPGEYNKKVKLPGEYIILGKRDQGEIIVEDLSMSGIRFVTMRPHQITADDTLEVIFKLNNPMRTEIRKSVKVIWIKDRIVGAQFSDPNLKDKDLGFYLRT